MKSALAFALPAVRQKGDGGSPPGPTPYEGAVATRARFRQTTLALAQVNSRTAYRAASDISSLKIVYANYRLQSNNPLPAAGPAQVTVYAAVEYPAGTFTALTWDAGADHADIAAGALKESDYSPTLPVTIPAGEYFWISMFEQSAGTSVLTNAFRNNALGEVHRSAASGLTNQYMTATKTGGTASDRSSPVIAIVSPNATNAAVFGAGDSKCLGWANDTPEVATASGPGLIGEIFKSFTDDMVFLNAARGGEQALNWLANDANTWGLAKYYSHLVVQLGRNDLTFGRTAAQIKTSVEGIITSYKTAKADGKATCATVTPKTTSTSKAYLGGGDQTTDASEAQRVLHNANVRGGLIAGNDNGFCELADAVEPSRDAGFWKLHPNGRTLNDAAMSASTRVVTTAGAQFSVADVGLGICPVGAGSSGSNLNTWIATFTSSTSVTCDNATGLASNTVGPGATCYVGALTLDGLHENPAGFSQIVAAGGVPLSLFER